MLSVRVVLEHITNCYWIPTKLLYDPEMITKTCMNTDIEKDGVHRICHHADSQTLFRMK